MATSDQPRSPKAPGYSTDVADNDIFTLAEPDPTPWSGPLRTRWAVRPTGAAGPVVETPDTSRRERTAA